MKDQPFRRLRSSILILIVLSTVGSLMLGGPLAAQNIFKGIDSTVGGYPTWDSDLINIESTSQTGAAVYVAVLDTGLVPNWRDYFPEARIATRLGTGFDQSVVFKKGNVDPCGHEVEVGPLRQTTWVGSVSSTHGTHVTSTIIGYFYDANIDAAAGLPLPPILVRGIAPDVTIIPVKVLADDHMPALPHCDPPVPAQTVTTGTEEMIAAGIDYVTDLAIEGYRPMVINMSIVGAELTPVLRAAIDRAIANGVIVVAAAGNDGTEGMSYPGAYAPVISAGASGWIWEWFDPATIPILQVYRLWWLQSGFHPFVDIPEPTPVGQVYVTASSSRERPGQELDVLAPGSQVRGPFPDGPGYSHLPWWSSSMADLRRSVLSNFFFLGGTSMAAPHVASVAALLLQTNPSLAQGDVESILKTTALPIPAGSAIFYNRAHQALEPVSWGADATGAGLIRADAAVAATP